MRRLATLAAAGLLGLTGLLLAAPAHADHTDPCPHGDPQCELPPVEYPDELGTAADQADDRAATGLGTAADAIAAARTRQGR